MPTKKEQLQEFKADDGQSVIPEPIAMDGHKDRGADNNAGETAQKQFATKVEAINAVVSALAPFQTQQIADFLQNIGTGNAHANRPLDKSGKLDGTVAFKGATKEDIDELFAGADLNEEQSAKALTLFEAAVGLKAAAIEVGLNEKFENDLAEAVDQIREEVTKDNEKYLNYVAEKWLEENQVAIQSDLKVKMAESFITKLVDLLAEHQIILPESVDVVEDLTARLEEANTKLAEAIDTINEQADEILGYQMNEKFIEVTEGLALTQVEKLRTLVENVEASDLVEFETKLNVLKDALLENKSNSASNRGGSLNEEVFLDENETKPTSVTASQVNAYADAISRHVKN